MSESQVLIENPPVFARLLRHRESRHAVKYGIVGVSNVAIDFALYALLLYVGVWYGVAKTLSLIVATINGYTWNRRWTFRAGRYQHVTLARYVLVQAVALSLNLVVLAVLVELVGVGALLAQAIALPFIATFTFLSNRMWTFGGHLPPLR